MGGFTMPSFPGLPTLPNVKSFLNTSPPLVYPQTSSPASTPRRRTREDIDEDTPTRSRPPGSQTLVPSPSLHDVQLDWERVDRTRRSSLSSVRSIGDESHSGLIRSDSSTSLNHRPIVMGSPNRPRPVHRRSQSVIHKRPGPSSRSTVAPMGTLHEISRNPLASSSAISLPTLCEMGDGADTNLWQSIPPSPVSLPRSRRPSQGQKIASIDTEEEEEETDTSSVSSSFVLPAVRTRHSRSFSSVPPPNIMAPPPLRPLRPPSSPRRCSVQEMRYGQPSSASQSRRSSMSISSSTSVSDVEVMATWSFPTDPAGSGGIATGNDRPAERLRDRLKRLSELDTTSLTRPLPSSQSAVTGTNLPVDQRPRIGMLRRSNTTGNTGQSSRHRYTHSSPISALPLPPVSVSGPIVKGTATPLLPPPKPPRRPTTSRLRHPSVLSMPVDIDRQPLHPWSNSGCSSSSPGSLLSDGGRSTSGSDGEVSSPTGSVLSLPPIQNEKEDDSRGHKPTVGMFGWGPKREQVPSRTASTYIEDVSVRMRGSLFISTNEDSEGDQDQEERYLSLDDI